MRLVAMTAFEAYALQFLAALIAAGPRGRRILALVVALPELALPWQVPAEHTLWRAALALMGFVCCVRVLDLVLARKELSPLRRIWHAFAFVDTMRLKYAGPALDGAAALRACAYGALTVGAAWACFVFAPGLADPARTLTRLGAGAAFMVGLTDAAYAAATLGFRAMGVVVYDLHRAPVLSRTVQEFWGERWARTVSMWLFARIFRPLARRRLPGLGLAASFAASALLHAYVMLPALGWWAAGMWGAYFMVQAGLVVVERALRVPRWPRPLAHTWVVVVMLASSPLMVEPMLRLVGPGQIHSSSASCPCASWKARSTAGATNAFARASTRYASPRAAKPVATASSFTEACTCSSVLPLATASRTWESMRTSASRTRRA
ncbi:MAG TPA: MBOAT family protein [Polyangiaceae bacterium]|nr:MBOAT family protein [Polyangiaceae bacterium]